MSKIAGTLTEAIRRTAEEREGQLRNARACMDAAIAAANRNDTKGMISYLHTALEAASEAEAHTKILREIHGIFDLRT